MTTLHLELNRARRALDHASNVAWDTENNEVNIKIMDARLSISKAVQVLERMAEEKGKGGKSS